MKGQSEAVTIPALPCVSMEETLPFYEALGFEVTYRQRSPNPYAVVRRDGYELHFYGLKGLKPEEGFSTCLVIVAEVEELHRTYAAALRKVYGKLPIAGFPHITRMRPGQGRFTLVDPAGNSVIYIKREAHLALEEKGRGEGKEGGKRLSRLGKALEAAAVLRDSKGDDAMAAKVLDIALVWDENADRVELARALAARIELAVAMGDTERVAEFREELAQVRLSEEEREGLRDELEAAERLERALLPTGDQ